MEALRNYHDPLPGVPKVESPFFESLFDDTDTRFRIAKDLHENGFAVLDFPDNAFDERADQIKRELNPLVDWAAWEEKGGEARISDAWRFNRNVVEIASNPKILELLEFLYGRRAFPFQTLTFPVGTQQHYHTDSVHFSAMPERFMCGVWVALEDIGPDQGPLLYYPGSHRWPIYRHEHIGHSYKISDGLAQSRFHDMWQRLVEVKGIKPERFYPRKGQALIWAANLLHGGDAHNDRKRTRWSNVTHYYFDDCVYYTPLGSNEPAGELLLRTPDDIAAGGYVTGKYLGRPVSDSFSGRGLPGDAGMPPFNPARYIELNPDVGSTGHDPWQHFILHGMAERRRWF